MKLLLKLFLFLILLAVIGLGYTGFLPGISRLMGTDKPRDLGVLYSEAAYNAGLGKTGTQVVALPAGTPATESIAFTGSHGVKQGFTSEEITAAAQNRKWVNWPFRGVQVRINNDGTGEATGIIKMNSVYSYAAALGVSSKDLDKAMETVRIPKMDMPFYVKISAAVTDGNVTMDIKNAEFGRIPVPGSIVSQYQPRIVSFVEDGLKRWSGLTIKSLTFVDGQVQFDGTMPDVEATIEQ